jgi:glycosyltransferase involved in cell wall biosynthesis
MNEFEPDLVWIHTIGPLGLMAARLSKNKYSVIYTKHCFDGDLWCLHLKVPAGFQWFYKIAAILAERQVLKYCDTVLYHFDSTEKILNNKFFNKFKHMPPPLNEKFVNEKSYREERHNDGIITIGFCGRLDPEKNIEMLFRAADIYQKKYKNKNIKLILIGEGHAVDTIVSQYPHINAEIIGFVDNIVPYLDQLDAYILASKTETTSLSSLEAYARGLPIFSTPVGFLGQNADKYQHIYNFITAEELASLINEVLNIKHISIVSPLVRLGSPIITFSEFHKLVVSEYL